MAENYTNQSLYQDMANELGNGWLVRRIRLEGNKWVARDFYGKLSTNILQASEIMLDILKRSMFQREIIVVVYPAIFKRKSKPISVQRIDHNKELLLKYLDGMQSVGSASFGLPNSEVIKHYNRDSNVTANQWKILFQILSDTPECNHLLISGSKISLDQVAENLSTLVGYKKNEERKLLEVQDMVYSSYEKELIKTGFIQSNITKVRAHLDSISDSGTEKSIKKILLNIPWQKRVRIERDLRCIRQSLDQSLFGMQETKQEVLAAIAGSLLSDSKIFRPPYILLHGEPGTGKTAMAKAIAKALRMPLESIAMNGVSSGPSIVGLEPCWNAAQPGKIIQSMVKSSALNPVLLLDEIDKAGSDDKYISSINALLQILDPLQNKSFCDLYVNVPLDVSEVFFIATANDIGALPEPLLDRLEIIHIPEYSVQEKKKIMPFLLKEIEQEKQLSGAFQFTASALMLMEERLLPSASLRKIKGCLWRMLCEAALLATDIGVFKNNLVVDEYVVELILNVKALEKPSKNMGFL